MIGFPVCMKCGRMLTPTEKGLAFIGVADTPDGRGPCLLYYHEDVCDGKEIKMLDPVKILSEQGLLPKEVTEMIPASSYTTWDEYFQPEPFNID